MKPYAQIKMHIRQFSLATNITPCQHSIHSFHFGPQTGKKVYLQASLHADELPGMLVLTHFKKILQQAENENKLRAEFVLVPIANPIGLTQTVLYQPIGRFELNSKENFNRNFPDISDALIKNIKDQLNQDEEHNTKAIRNSIFNALDHIKPTTALENLRLTLLKLAHDADIALDLHCETQGVVHLYTSTDPKHIRQAKHLGSYLMAQVILTANEIGSGCFDEMLFKPYLALQQHYPNFPISQACLASTVELRGQNDVSHNQAKEDALALYTYFCDLNLIEDHSIQSTPPYPPCTPTPLAGSETLYAPYPGLISYLAQVGDTLKPGDAIAEIINPLNDQTQIIQSPIHGVLYARALVRYAYPDTAIAKIAGHTAKHKPSLLGP